MGLGEVGTQGNEGGKGLRARRTLEGLGEDTGDFLQADTGGQRGGGAQGSIVWGLQWESKERGEKAVPLLTLWKASTERDALAPRASRALASCAIGSSKSYRMNSSLVDSWVIQLGDLRTRRTCFATTWRRRSAPGPNW